MYGFISQLCRRAKKKTGDKALKTKIIQRQKHNIQGEVTGLPHFEHLIHIHLSLTQENSRLSGQLFSQLRIRPV